MFNNRQKTWTGTWIQNGISEKVELTRSEIRKGLPHSAFVGDWTPIEQSGCLHIVEGAENPWAHGEALGAWTDNNGWFGMPLSVPQFNRTVVHLMFGLGYGSAWQSTLLLSADKNSLSAPNDPSELQLGEKQVYRRGCYVQQLPGSFTMQGYAWATVLSTRSSLCVPASDLGVFGIEVTRISNF